MEERCWSRRPERHRRRRASIGALPAQLVIADGLVPVSAAALVSQVIQLAEVVAANERRFGVSYQWSDESRAVASRFDLVARAAEIAGREPQPAPLMVTGAEDDPAFAQQMQRLHSALQHRYSDPGACRRDDHPPGRDGACLRRGTRHRAAPPTPQARRVDAAITSWFTRHLG